MEPASSKVPNEIWTRIIELAAPPGREMKGETALLPEVLARRPGQEKEEEDWTTIGSLFLVSKRMNQLVSPTFHSFARLKKPSQVSGFAQKLQAWTDSDIRDERLQLITSLEYDTSDWSASDDQILHIQPLASIIQCLPNLVFLRLIGSHPTSMNILVAIAAARPPLHSLLGICVGSNNFAASLVALSSVASTLHHLEVVQASLPLWITQTPLPQEALLLPELRTLGFSLAADAVPSKLVFHRRLLAQWRLPKVERIIVGGTASFEKDEIGLETLFAPGPASSVVRRVGYSSLLGLLRSHDQLRALPNLDELAFRVSGLRWVADQLGAVQAMVMTTELKPLDRVTTLNIEEPPASSPGPQILSFVVEDYISKFPSLETLRWIAPAEGDSMRTCWTAMLLRISQKGLAVSVIR